MTRHIPTRHFASLPAAPAPGVWTLAAQTLAAQTLAALTLAALTLAGPIRPAAAQTPAQAPTRPVAAPGGDVVTIDWKLPAGSRDAPLAVGRTPRPIVICVNGGVPVSFQLVRSDGTFFQQEIGGKAGACQVAEVASVVVKSLAAETSGSITLSLRPTP